MMDQKGQEIYNLVKKIFPYPRSITGDGVRQTLSDLAEYLGTESEVKLTVHEVKSGTPVFDWTVPKEWKIRDAYIADEAGNRVVDWKKHNLHVVGYSTPVDRTVDLEELQQYLYTEPNQPDVIPYVTSYYKERYGFCLSEKAKQGLSPGKYRMVIDSELFDGSLTYGEIVLPGESEREVFFSTYTCHPSMANDECSGPAVSAALARYVASLPKRHYTYRFLYIPETIGSITYLATDDHLEHLKRTMVAGFNLSCVGDDRNYSMIETRYADTLSDRVLKNVLRSHTDNHYRTYSFLKRGSDERQYGAPGVELPVVCFCRTRFDEFPEYHTSADDLSLVSPAGLQGSYEVLTQVIDALEKNRRYHCSVLCEPQLGKRGLYPDISRKGSYDDIFAMRDLITYADGKEDLIAISDRIGVPVRTLLPILEQLLAGGVLQAVSET